jgi:sugar diacid utilization regulator
MVRDTPQSGADAPGERWTGEDAWLEAVARDASQAAGGIPAELLGDYLSLLADAATSGRRPQARELNAVGLLGRRAAELGVSAGNAVQLYLSAAWRLWGELPAVVRSNDSESVRDSAEAVLRVVDRAVASLAEGYTAARRDMMRHEESLRHELIEDLLRGDADVGGLAERAEPFGMDMGQPHQVALAASTGRLTDAPGLSGMLERAVVGWAGDRDILVSTKDGWIVVIAPGDPTPGPGAGQLSSARDLGALMHTELSRSGRGAPWRITVGRPYPGAYGIAHSYEEAREALTMAIRLRLDTPVIHANELLIYRVLLRDQPAIADLVHTVISPLSSARGGPEPLLSTLDAYFATGCVVTETARRMHLSVRAVSYRLERIATLTGYDPADPAQRFTVHAAVLGARLLGWPRHDLAVGKT